MDLNEQDQELQQRYIEALRDDVVLHNPKYEILKTIATLMADVNATPEFTRNLTRGDFDDHSWYYLRSDFFSRDVDIEAIENDFNQRAQFIESTQILMNEFISQFNIDNIRELLQENDFVFADTINAIYTQIIHLREIHVQQDLRESFHFKWKFARFLALIFCSVFSTYIRHQNQQIIENAGNPDAISHIVQSFRDTIMCPDFYNIQMIYPIKGLFDDIIEIHLSYMININFNHDFYTFVNNNLIGNPEFQFFDYDQDSVKCFHTSLLRFAIEKNQIDTFERLIDEYRLGLDDDDDIQNCIYINQIFPYIFVYFWNNDQNRINYEMIDRYGINLMNLLAENQLEENQLDQFIDEILIESMQQLIGYENFHGYFNLCINWLQNRFDPDGVILPELHSDIFNRDEFLRILGV